MKLLLKISLFLTICIACSEAISANAKTTPSAKQVVYQFYKTYQRTDQSGLPSPADMIQLKPFLSAKLITAIQSARIEQAQFIQKNPTEKPPYIEGDLFSSLFESFTDFSVGKDKISHKTHTITINFVYANAAKKPAQWHDEAIVIKESGHYVIENIRLLGAGAFNSAGNLLGNLTQNHQ